MRDPMDYLDGVHELAADIEDRDADLRDADFLAPRRRTPAAADTRTPEERTRDRARVAELDARRARREAMPFAVRVRCEDCGLTWCPGGAACKGDRT